MEKNKKRAIGWDARGRGELAKCFRVLRAARTFFSFAPMAS